MYIKDNERVSIHQYLNQKYFSNWALKELQKEKVFDDIPEEDFLEGKNNFIQNVISNNIYFHEDFSINLFNLIKQKYLTEKIRKI